MKPKIPVLKITRPAAIDLNGKCLMGNLHLIKQGYTRLPKETRNLLTDSDILTTGIVIFVLNLYVDFFTVNVDGFGGVNPESNVITKQP